MIRIEPLGDRALLVSLAGEGGAFASAPMGAGMHARVRAVTSRLARESHEAISDVVPAYASVAVHYDPAAVRCRRDETPHEALSHWVANRLEGVGASQEEQGPLVEIPVRYGGANGPDLAELASARGLTPADVVALHTAPEYVVHFVGFMPGFAYLGGLDERLATPRRAVPRTSVPAGSVAIGGTQTGVYPVPSPGGWQLIGRTDTVLFDPARSPAALLAAGDRVRFVAIEIVAGSAA